MRAEPVSPEKGSSGTQKLNEFAIYYKNLLLFMH